MTRVVMVTTHGVLCQRAVLFYVLTISVARIAPEAILVALIIIMTSQTLSAVGILPGCAVLVFLQLGDKEKERNCWSLRNDLHTLFYSSLVFGLPRYAQTQR